MNYENIWDGKENYVIHLLVNSYKESNEIVENVLIAKYLKYNLQEAIDYVEGILKNNSKFTKLFLEYDKIGYNNFINKYGNGK